MRIPSDTVRMVAKLAGGLALVALLLAAPVAGAFLVFLNGLALYAFLRDRQGRQEELLQVLAVAVDTGMPLASAVRAYLRERPRRGFFRKAGGVILCVILPLYTYARIWFGWRRFDTLLRELVRRLEQGESLAEALEAVPGLAPPEARLAVAIGERTGTLGLCLRSADHERWSAAWLEVAPRLAYPLLVLLTVSSIASFLLIAVLPKYKKIFQEFDLPLPNTTDTLASWSSQRDDYSLIVGFVQLFVLVAAAVWIANPTLRWYTPILGRLYRWGMQAQVLRTLGQLLAVGQTVPQALAFLADSDALPAVVRRRLAAAMTATQSGEPLADSLQRGNLLSPAMAPLVRSAQATNTLPWALVELGDYLAGRALRLVRRLSIAVFPLLIVAVGVVVGFIALAFFLPLIDLLTSVSQW